MRIRKEMCAVIGVLLVFSASTIVMAQEENTDSYPSIVDIAGSGASADEQPEIECSEELIHASAGSGLVQVNDTIIKVNDAEHHTSADKYGKSMTVRELCDALDITPVDQHTNEAIDMDDIEHENGKLWLDEENFAYMVFGTNRYQYEEPVSFGDLSTDSFSTKTYRYTGVLWFPGGISSTGILSDGVGVPCTSKELLKTVTKI
jgi:hypothetical protein